MIRAAGLAITVLAASWPNFAQTATSTSASAPQLTQSQRQLNLDSFEQVWAAVRDKHWQIKPGGLDWQAVHGELRPVIEKAESMDAARAVMRDMLGRLHQTHFAIIPSDLYSDLDGAGTRGEITAALDVRVVGADALVTSVEDGSSAASEGVHAGWQILKIGSTDLAPIVEKLNQTYAQSSLRDIVLRRAVLSRLEGKPGQSTAVEFLDGGGARVTKAIIHGQPKGTLTQFGYLYPTHVWLDMSKAGDGNIGLVKFNMFLDPARVMNLFGEAVQSCQKCDGFIIDLRGNPGGIGAMAMGMAGWFIDQPDRRLGTLFMRDTTLKFVVNPRLTTFSGPLAILVDGASASTSEILAGGLKDLGRARIFGERTAAAALPSVFEMLPNGDGFQYAIANYISEGGKPLEGLGVMPDVETPLTRKALLDGQDPALDAAIRWIKTAPKDPPRATNQKPETRN